MSWEVAVESHCLAARLEMGFPKSEAGPKERTYWPMSVNLVITICRVPCNVRRTEASWYKSKPKKRPFCAHPKKKGWMASHNEHCRKHRTSHPCRMRLTDVPNAMLPNALSLCLSVCKV